MTVGVVTGVGVGTGPVMGNSNTRLSRKWRWDNTVASLPLVFGSVPIAVTLAVLAIVPGVVEVTMIVAVALSPLAKVPRPQVTVLPASAQPAEAERKVTLSGNVSLRVTQ